MIQQLVGFSLKNKFLILLLVAIIAACGIFALLKIPVGAVPDITNNQVQIITTSRNLATEDIEKFVTAPVELEMANLPGVKEIRSISKFGLSVVTVIFEDQMGTYLPRQLLTEKLTAIGEKIPKGFGTPSMGPITTGLGEIYQYVLDVKPEYRDRYSITDLRTIQDWIVKRQLSGIPGVVEVNTWGGLLKTYEVAVKPKLLLTHGITLSEVYEVLATNNSVAGGGYIEKTNEAFFIRAEGLLTSIDDIKNIVVHTTNGLPIFIKDIADVGFGHATRFGAITGNGEGEKVLGQIMMLKGASSNTVIEKVKDRVATIQSILPEGVFINPFLERSELLDRTTFTIVENLILGCLIVIFVVILLLGNFRSGLVVASVIPLCLLFAISLMYVFGVDANLMSLGAIDFGIIIDGAVIIVEYIAFKIAQHSSQFVSLDNHSRQELVDNISLKGTVKMMRSAIFGQLIIIIVFIPILTLSGVEGKMFIPMALTFCFALLGAMLLCFTYVPVVCALFIKGEASSNRNISTILLSALENNYERVIRVALAYKGWVLSFALLLLVFAGYLFSQMGGEFIPTLDEGDFVIQPVLKTGMSLEQTVKMTTRMEKIIKTFPEVNQVVSRIGAAEIPTDPMSMEESDIIITLKPKREWTSTSSKDALADKIKLAIEHEIPAVEIEFTQPIEMRFNELITGVRADLAIKLFGDNLEILNSKGQEIKKAIENVSGASDVTIEKTVGLPQMKIAYDRQKMARYGVNVAYLNDLISMGIAGKTAGVIFEGERQFDLTIRYNHKDRDQLDDLKNALVSLPDGTQLPLSTFSTVEYTTGPAKISRDDTKRRVVVSVNVRGRDLQSVVNEVRAIIETKVSLPAGYIVEYGGQFENLTSATKRLQVAVPVALLLIFILLYFAFHSFLEALLVFSAIPLASVGGIFLLHLRDMPFSISAGVGFIALFGIAVLNGIVLIEHFKELKQAGMTNLEQRIKVGTKERLRPVLLTATAAALGFLPMAISSSAGAEVQKPLATVVIGGLFTATLLTLVVLPILYAWIEQRNSTPTLGTTAIIFILLSSGYTPLHAQTTMSLEQAIAKAESENLQLKSSELGIQKSNALVNTYAQSEKTGIYYHFDRNNLALNDRPIHVIGFQQNFKSPSYFNAYREFNQSQVGISESVFEMDRYSIARDVSNIYVDILYWQDVVEEYAFLDSLFLHFEQASTRKYQLGEAFLLEKITAASKHRKITSELNNAIKNEELARIKLQRWIQDDSAFTLDRTSIDFTSSASDISTHPTLTFQQKRLNSMILGHQALEQNKLPEWNVAVFGGANSFRSLEFFPGIQLGVSLSLLNHKHNKALSNASKIEIQLQENEIDKQKRALSKYREQLLSELSIVEYSIEQYIQFDQQYQSDIILSASSLYQNGEIDYFAYIQAIESVIEIKLLYLYNTLQANHLKIELKYLMH